jgi:hypothetical protein
MVSELCLNKAVFKEKEMQGGRYFLFKVFSKQKKIINLLYAVYHQKLHPPFFPTLLGGS